MSGDRIACPLYCPATAPSWPQCFIDRKWGTSPVIPEVLCRGIPGKDCTHREAREGVLREIEAARDQPAYRLVRAARKAGNG